MTRILGPVQFKRTEVTIYMDTTTEVPTVWNQLAENMYLKDSPTAEVRLSERASFSFGRIQSTVGLPEITQPVVGERGHIVVLQFKPIPFVEQFSGKKRYRVVLTQLVESVQST